VSQAQVKNFIQKHQFFSLLDALDVSFYDPGRRARARSGPEFLKLLAMRETQSGDYQNACLSDLENDEGGDDIYGQRLLVFLLVYNKFTIAAQVCRIGVRQNELFVIRPSLAARPPNLALDARERLRQFTAAERRRLSGAPALSEHDHWGAIGARLLLTSPVVETGLTCE